ncbi:MAG: hypothetical protein ACKV2T_07195 [Kofleriaceae bacterium]
MNRLLLVLAACGAPTPPPASPENLAGPAELPTKPPGVAVQLGYRGTFMIGPPFAHVPPFTLLDDGTLIVAKGNDPIVTTKLSRTEVDAIVRRVRDLGVERLESHTESCSKPTPRGIRVCVSDSSFSVLRVALPSGLREIVTYDNFSNDPETHEQIVGYLAGYQPIAATLYRPTFGVLHVQTHAPAGACTATDPALLRIANDSDVWGFRLEGAAFAAVVGLAAERRSFVACAAGRRFTVTIVPGIPGADHLDAELAVYKRS